MAGVDRSVVGADVPISTYVIPISLSYHLDLCDYCLPAVKIVLSLVMPLLYIHYIQASRLSAYFIRYLPCNCICSRPFAMFCSFCLMPLISVDFFSPGSTTFLR